MKILQFKTQKEYDEWLNSHELFECYDKDENLLGSILGPDADMLVKFNLAWISVTYGHCNLTKELTEEQMDALKKNTLVRIIILENIFHMSIEQRTIIRRLKKNFEDARKVGLQILTNDEENTMYFINGNAIDKVTNEDDMCGKWEEVDGKMQLIPFTDEELSHYVKVDTDLFCMDIKGDRQIDFVSWGCTVLPWYVHLKD